MALSILLCCIFFLYYDRLFESSQFFKSADVMIKKDLLGNSKSVKFWTDKWCTERALYCMFPDLFSISLKKTLLLIGSLLMIFW